MRKGYTAKRLYEYETQDITQTLYKEE
ncbi:Nodule Cysteine-Rich (NCR) secreted peptide [Medicago truncatula]|uniref:Nodule Cysteine-Rich (NCR) secreted peptide n=1 Tax=Medicago truncatula TaxID=3880 RepID=A0A072V1J1_MEDTR|nr:Nodule Cysteine-Rich (NCR) secreted peptide [Medicago truncatula]